MSVSTGSAVADMPFRSESDYDISFRILTSYHVGTDGFMVRLDVIKNGVQSNTGFYASAPRQRGQGQVGDGNLVMPNGAFEGFSIRANKIDIVAALRGIADRLEQEE